MSLRVTRRKCARSPQLRTVIEAAPFYGLCRGRARKSVERPTPISRAIADDSQDFRADAGNQSLCKVVLHQLPAGLQAPASSADSNFPKFSPSPECFRGDLVSR